MSVTVMGMVWASGLPKNQKMTLLAYADYANDDGDSIFPGEEAIADKTSDSPGNVRRVTAQLIKAGILERTKKGYRGQRAEYRIDLEKLAVLTAEHNVEKGAQYARLSGGVDGEKGAHISPKGAHTGKERRALTSRKARTGATPNVIEPSVEPSEPSLVAVSTQKPPGRKRDLLWEAVVSIHGDPVGDVERGRLNKAVGELRKAKVDEVEYPKLVAAFATKYARRDQPPPQPTAITIATRIGMLRHFIDNGPIGAPLGTLDDLVAEQKRAQEVAMLEAHYGKDGKTKTQRIEESA